NLERFRKEGFDVDFIMVIDLDLISIIYLDGMFNTFGWFSEDKNSKIGAICAYGLYRVETENIYYDTFAHLDKSQDRLDVGRKWIHDIKKGMFDNAYSRGNDLVPVNSCFGGLTVYRASV